jgi:hypothetical protein
VEQAAGAAAHLAVCDVTDEAAVDRWVSDTSAALGDRGLDVLVATPRS